MRTRFVLMGGFLGAGKTTMIQRVAKELVDQERRVAVIANDQGEYLVDTEYLSQGFSAGEVTGGCFCCNFDELVNNTERLLSEHRPEIIFAEPVGSCTDLMATVIAPLKQMYPDRFSVAPLIILADAERLLERSFDRASLTGYLRAHQVEEAEVVLISKIDLVDEGALKGMIHIVEGMNPSARVIPCSALTPFNIERVTEIVLSGEESRSRPRDIDYDTYALAEAELGWYNGLFEFIGQRYDCYDLISHIFRTISSEFHQEDVAHAKIMIISDSNAVKMSLILGYVTVGGVTGSRYGEGPSRMIINARIVSDPDRLREVLRRSVKEALGERRIALDDWRDESFSPSPPKPTYRMT